MQLKNRNTVYQVKLYCAITNWNIAYQNKSNDKTEQYNFLWQKNSEMKELQRNFSLKLISVIIIFLKIPDFAI